MIPLMTRLTKMTQIQAHGTSLVAVVFTSLVGALTQSTRPRGARPGAAALSGDDILFQSTRPRGGATVYLSSLHGTPEVSTPKTSLANQRKLLTF